MKTYSVKELAGLFKVDEETIRRWIRSGKLKSTISARKNGNVISEQDLKEFVKTRPKYLAAIAATNAMNDFAKHMMIMELCNLKKQRDKLDDQISQLITSLREKES